MGGMNLVHEITVPDIGDFHDIPVIELLVKAGDRVQKDTPLVVLESDKATLDVPSSQAGIIKELRVALGSKVSCGSVIAILEAESNSSRPATVATLDAAQFDAKPEAPEQWVTSSVATQVASVPVQPLREHSPAAQPPLGNLPAINTVARLPRASPSLRRFARELGVDLTAVSGSGPGGRILKADLQSHIKTAINAAKTPTSATRSTGLNIAPWPDVDFSKFGRVERVALSKIRKLTGENLARNWVMIPHVTNFEEADITGLEAFRKKLISEEFSGRTKITMLAFLIKAAVVVLKKFPEFNSSLVGDELVLKHFFHIGFAADTPNGLVVPVIRDADTKGISQIAAEAGLLAGQARDGKLKLSDMQGGCFTISSLGGIGGTGFTPIINAPEVAILGVTRAQMRPMWTGSEFQPRLILPLALSWDHRVIDGAAAARFNVYLGQILSEYRRILL